MSFVVRYGQLPVASACVDPDSRYGASPPASTETADMSVCCEQIYQSKGLVSQCDTPRESYVIYEWFYTSVSHEVDIVSTHYGMVSRSWRPVAVALPPRTYGRSVPAYRCLPRQRSLKYLPHILNCILKLYIYRCFLYFYLLSFVENIHFWILNIDYNFTYPGIYSSFVTS